MAILNNILRGQLKGRIGNNWCAHAVDKDGRPITRTGTINSNPKNPKTAKQMEQRSRFANAVKFYRHAVQNFFKFAFEDRRANESDYNAFMRHNVKYALNLYKSQVDNPYFPALANKWQLSQGVLAAGLIHSWLNDNDFDLGFSGDTIGEISQYLVSVHGLYNNDIVTIVGVTSMVNSSNYNNTDAISQAPIWHIWQFYVDTKSNTPIAEIAHTGVSIGNLGHRNNTKEIYLEFGNEGHSNFAAVVITRKAGRKLLASTTYLEPNSTASDLIAALEISDTAESALKSWGVGEDVILKGSIADDNSSSVSIASVNSADPPASITNQQAGRVVELSLSGSGLDTLSKSSFITKGCDVSSYTATRSGKSATLDIVTGSILKTQTISYGAVTIAEIAVTNATGGGGNEGESTVTSIDGHNIPATFEKEIDGNTMSLSLSGTHLDEVSAKDFSVDKGSIKSFLATSSTNAALVINIPDDGDYMLSFAGTRIATISVSMFTDA